MTHYRLLRDNKESGPFPEEEMIAKGFKPYDLIWVEGKSAGWRYPSEIPAFKPFAPAIEEQPYDRFYKKQPPQKLFASEEKNTHSDYTPVETKTISPVSKTNETIQPQQFPVSRPAPDYTIQSLPGRHIHVTLPSGNTVNLTTLVTRKENKLPPETNEVNKTPATPESRQPAFSAPVYNAAPAGIKEAAKKIIASPAARTSIETEMPYSQQPNEYQPAAGFSWSLIAAAFIGIATLVGLGIMIGLSMNREKNDLAFNESLRNKSKPTIQVLSNSITAKPSSSNTIPDLPATAINDGAQRTSSAGKELVQNAVVKSTVSTDNINDTKEIKKLPEEKPVTDKNKASATQDETFLHATPVPVIINIEKNLSLTASDFKTGAFGGISGLKCILYNNSKFLLESVEVEVDYIQANNKIFKTEKILFKDVSAGSRATIEAPSSNRGVKVTSRIIKVNAKDTALSNNTAKS